MDKQHILSEIRRLAKENGGTAPGRLAIQRASGIRESDWLGKHWVRWSDALREAGLAPNQFQSAYEDEELLEPLIGFIRELGHYPVRAELLFESRRNPAFPNEKTLRRLGSKGELAALVVERYGTKPGFEDVVAICTPLAAPAKPASVPEKMNTENDGVVYLLKSGRYFKIGRTNSAGRRERELAIQLPEKASTVHVISTDDPPGIEAYWHRRFADRRKNGEWFELTVQDVKAFRRRKFM